jgi:hypothetical protein
MSSRRPPPPEAWDAFCDLLERGAGWLAQSQPSPDPGLTAEQFGVGMLVSAIEGLLLACGQPDEFVLLAQRLSTAWQNLRNNRPDALLASGGGSGRPAPEQAMLWFRAELLRLLDEMAARSRGTKGTRGRPATLRPIAQEIERALRRANAPKGCTPSAQTILNLHAKAANPRTPTDRVLADQRRSIETSLTEGDTVETRVGWILAELAKWPGRRP